MKLHSLLVAALATTSLLSAQDASSRAYGSSLGHTTNGEARLFTPEMAVLGTNLRLALDYDTPDNDAGVFLISAFDFNLVFPFYGFTVLTNPFFPLGELPFTTGAGDRTDIADVAVPNDPSILGAFYVQAVIADVSNPGTLQGLLASDGLEVTIGVQEPAQTGELVITEIMQNPSAVGDSDGEYIEIYNPGTADIDIEGWWIHDEDFDGVRLLNGGNGIIVPAGGYRVLAVNDDNTLNGGITGAFSWGYDTFFLSNGSDEVILARPDLTRVDVVRYDGGPNFPDPTGASMSLLPAFLNAQDNDNGANWAAATAAYGAGDLGTPGSAN